MKSLTQFGTAEQKSSGSVPSQNQTRAAEKILREMSGEDFLQLLEEASPEELAVLATAGQSARVGYQANSLLLKPTSHSGLRSIARWWEARRLEYNLIVGLCGLPTLVLLTMAHADAVLLLSGTLFYGIAANICYSLGTPAELAAWLIWRRKSCHIGPVLYVTGTAFSVLLTLGVALVIMLCMLF